MTTIVELIEALLTKNGLVAAFAIVGILTYISYAISKYLTNNKVHGSSIAIILGLMLAYIGGTISRGDKGLSSVPTFAGIGLLGGSMMRDFTIVSTAFGADLSELKKCGISGAISLIVGVFASFVIGGTFAVIEGFSKPEDIATIAAGAVTFVVGPVTGAAVGADSSIIAISIAIGVVKSISVMVITPFMKKIIKLDTPRQALIFGGLLGTTSGTSAAMAAINPKLVPYAAMTSTFYTGLGCLVCPSILYLSVLAICG